MSNNSDNITVSDFENICRICLSRENLKLLYEKCFPSTCLVDMLMYCTSVKVSEDDGLPGKICINCIYELKQAFLFAKRCERTDIILRGCVTTFETELANNSSQIKIKQEIILPNSHKKFNEVVDDYEFVAVKQEEDANYGEDYEENQSLIDEESTKLKDELGVICVIRTGEKPYSCEICEKAFSTNETLIYHERSHTDKKPSVCSVCNKVFTQPIHLKRHMRIHTGNEPYICGVCGKAFTHRSNLQYHISLHTGQKPYSCRFCSKSFTRSYSLRRHMTGLHIG